MKVDLVYVNDYTPKGKISVIRGLSTQKEAIDKFYGINEHTKVEYAFLRRFDGLCYQVVKWLKRKDLPSRDVFGV